MSTDLESRVTELETRLAFQEQALQDISNALALQQSDIEQLTVSLKAIRHQLQEMNTAAPSRADEKPPHY